MAKNQPVIIYRNRKSISVEQPYRSAMWKVAYADFITAMMAFFLLLWLLSVTPENTLKGIAKYFAPQTSVSDKAGLGFEGGADANIEEGIAAVDSASSSLVFGSPSRGRRVDQASKSAMMTEIEKQHLISVMSSIQHNAELKEFADNISLDVTNDGLRIQVMDSDNRPMFKPNTTDLEPYMAKILTVVGKLIKDQPNYIAISGHTASTKSTDKQNDIDHWSLSALRANQVRQFLTNDLIKSQQVDRIVGRADSDPFDHEDRYNVKNIRISITLLNSNMIGKFQQSAPIKSFK